MNSREKGKRGERQWRDELRAQGFTARRGQQFCGSPDSPDVICEEMAEVHFEVKTTEKFNIYDAMDQARRDAGTKVPIVVHRRNYRDWMVIMGRETFFRFYRGDHLKGGGTDGTDGGGDGRGPCEGKRGALGDSALPTEGEAALGDRALPTEPHQLSEQNFDNCECSCHDRNKQTDR